MIKYYSYLVTIFAFLIASYSHVVSAQQNDQTNSRIDDQTKGQVFKNYHKVPSTTVITNQLKQPWGITEVSRNLLLISEKRGRFVLVNKKTGNIEIIKGAPSVDARGQGGLLDVVMIPSLSTSQNESKLTNKAVGNETDNDLPDIYFTYSAAVSGDDKGTKPSQYSTTILAKAQLDLQNRTLTNIQTVFITKAYSDTSRHFGSRIAFDNKYLYFTVGDRGIRNNSQDLSNHAGSVIRLNRDGTIPWDNPFLENSNALPEIYSYGHRNPQGITLDNEGRLYVIEHGPRGGDEINQIESGNNYGWPIVSHGKEYWGPFDVGVKSHPGMEPAKKLYIPSIAPSSLISVKHDRYGWQGDLLAGSLKLTHLNHIHKKNNKIIKENRYYEKQQQRIRGLVEDSEGIIWLITDDGELWRLD